MYNEVLFALPASWLGGSLHKMEKCGSVCLFSGCAGFVLANKKHELHLIVPKEAV